jgi:methionyl-tRNA formyltransferase
METIYRIGGRIQLAVTLHDHLAPHKSGRVHIGDWCSRNDIDLIRVANVNEPAVIDAVSAKRIDWLFIIGWSQIARKQLLDAPVFGALGMHPTLLPEGRGRAPIPWAILKGLERTGVTLFRLNEGVDTGDIIAQEVLPIASDETATSLYDRVRLAHETLIERVWPALTAGAIGFQPQDKTLASQWPARTPEDGRITTDMDCRTADRLVRATTRPYPGAFFDSTSKRYRIWAGTVQPNCHVHVMNEVAQMMIPLSNGSFTATEWDEEELPPHLK